MSIRNQYEARSRSYPVQEDMRWQRLEWRIQRVGYIGLFTIVILGACGLFSKGILSDSKISSGDGLLQVEYERFGRLESDMAMTIRVRPKQANHFTLAINGAEMENFQIQSLQPQPLRAVSAKNTLIVRWAAPDSRSGATVWIGLQAQKPGRYPVTVTLDNQTSVRFTQWVYP